MPALLLLLFPVCLSPRFHQWILISGRDAGYAETSPEKFPEAGFDFFFFYYSKNFVFSRKINR